MHGDIDAPLPESPLEVFREQPFAPDRREGVFRSRSPAVEMKS